MPQIRRPVCAFVILAASAQKKSQPRAFGWRLGAQQVFKKLFQTNDATGREARSRRSVRALPDHVETVIEKESLKFKEVGHVLIEKVEQLFRDMF